MWRLFIWKTNPCTFPDFQKQKICQKTLGISSYLIYAVPLIFQLGGTNILLSGWICLAIWQVLISSKTRNVTLSLNHSRDISPGYYARRTPMSNESELVTEVNISERNSRNYVVSLVSFTKPLHHIHQNTTALLNSTTEV